MKAMNLQILIWKILVWRIWYAENGEEIVLERGSEKMLQPNSSFFFFFFFAFPILRFFPYWNLLTMNIIIAHFILLPYYILFYIFYFYIQIITTYLSDARNIVRETVKPKDQIYFHDDKFDSFLFHLLPSIYKISI